MRQTSSVSPLMFTVLRPVGGSKTLVKCTVTVAVAVPPRPSLMVYVKVSRPRRPGPGVYVSVPSGLRTTVLPTGWVISTTVSGSPSGSLSLPSTAIVTGVRAAVVTTSSRATGGVLPAGGTVGGRRSTLSVALLFAGVGSSAPAGGATLAVFSSVPAASGATVPVRVNV